MFTVFGRRVELVGAGEGLGPVEDAVICLSITEVAYI